MQDILRETEIYQYIMQEGFEKGIEQGREQEREQARQQELEDLRQVLLNFVQARFSELLSFATTQVAEINNVETLKNLTLKVVRSQGSNEVRKHILEANNKDKN